MAKYREHVGELLRNGVVLGDSGLETTLIYDEGWELPCFATFPFMKSERGRQRLKQYWMDHIDFAENSKCSSFLLGGIGWRCNRDWGTKLGYSQSALDEFIRLSVSDQIALRAEKETDRIKILLVGNMGGRGDGYKPESLMTSEEARDYHRHQISTYKALEIDVLLFNTVSYIDEALGVAEAAKCLDMPILLSFTLEMDGCLPSGQTLADAIRSIDTATNSYPIGYLINCVHPGQALDHLLCYRSEAWTCRLLGVKGNASRKSHAELNDSLTLDRGDVEDFGECYRQLREVYPGMNIFGGCCGTDLDHLRSLCQHCHL